MIIFPFFIRIRQLDIIMVALFLQPVGLRGRVPVPSQALSTGYSFLLKSTMLTRFSRLINFHVLLKYTQSIYITLQLHKYTIIMPINGFLL